MPRKLVLTGFQALAVALGLMVLSARPALAQAELESPVREESMNTSKPSGQDGAEYGGVVARAVISSLGDLFYRRFSESWSTQKDTANYVITVRENVVRSGNTEVAVAYQDDVLFRARLPRNQQAVITLSESAVDAVYQKIVELSLNELLNDDPDMARPGL